MEGRLQELEVDRAVQGLLGAGEKQGRPGVYRRVHVAEVPLVGRDLTVGVEVVPGKHEVELLPREVGVDDRQRDGVKCQVPGGIPGVLPFVGHGDDVVVDHVEPVAVAAGTARGVEGVGAVLLQPGVGIKIVVLLGPEHAGEGLAHDVGGIRRHRGG